LIAAQAAPHPPPRRRQRRHAAAAARSPDATTPSAALRQRRKWRACAVRRDTDEPVPILFSRRCSRRHFLQCSFTPPPRQLRFMRCSDVHASVIARLNDHNELYAEKRRRTPLPPAAVYFLLAAVSALRFIV